MNNLKRGRAVELINDDCPCPLCIDFKEYGGTFLKYTAADSCEVEINETNERALFRVDHIRPEMTEEQEEISKVFNV